MGRTPLRVGIAIVAAIAFGWVLGAIYDALFVVPVNGPEPYFHVPRWLEPFAYTARLLVDVAPGLLLGAIARWRPAALGFFIGFLTFYAAALIPENRFAALSASGLDWSLTKALYWAGGAIAGAYFMERWMPNTSLERTRAR